ncbi:hypothetical protein CAPTEDRAFT_215425 [Capitella teleta]|uniref:GDNF/GAS1 domain-containing protein n=1 Tax=Capitella teleta TaxID=283909 RepID=R7TZA7_CAPTE|nr:hypothetical protein CAPTEDRAFT_215425 [Capitella teleta]|eukprot:ELT99099.1 hypothetical protein CAPTEDRAFT_215425 [Capitella teleta]
MTTVLLGSPVTSYIMEDHEPISCLQGQARCHGDVSCRVLLGAMRQVCDKSIHSCETTERMHCHSVLSALQQQPYFRDCVCDPIDPHSSECIELQQMLYLHACLTRPEFNGTQLLRPSHQRPPTVSPWGIIEEQEARNMTCVELSKLCGKVSQCAQQLEDFKVHCRQNKESRTCIASSWQLCHAAIEGLRRYIPSLLTCQCETKKSQNSDKCLHLQTRISSNVCLAWAPYYVHSSPSHRVTSYHDLVSSAGFLSSTPDAATLSEQSQRLALCKCEHSNCRAIQQVLRPTCSVIERPPPSCTHLLHRCLDDPDCSTRWRSYKKHCSPSNAKICGSPPASARCRSAWLGIQGTIATTNCTCALTDDATRCADARRQLQEERICLDLAADDLHRSLSSLSDSAEEDVLGEQLASNSECWRQLTHGAPLFMNAPQVIRRYTNETDCPEVCECLSHNASLQCRHLPCAARSPCSLNEASYAHGSSVILQDRGPCRCIRAEAVCSRPPHLPSPMHSSQAGLFLHVGFSVSELYLIEEHSSMRMRPERLALKMATLLNGDSAQQFCKLDLAYHDSGYLKFRISVSSTSPNHHGNQTCIRAAQHLSLKINNRDSVIVYDAELSLMKVAQLEMVEFHSTISIL